MNSLFLMGNEPSLYEAPLTYLILAITVYSSYRCMDDHYEKEKFMFIPYVIQKDQQWYRFFSHGLVHANWMHLLFNAYVLLMFGGVVEVQLKHSSIFGVLGPIVYLALYISGLLMSSVYSFYKHRENRGYAALGASGAVSSVVFASILLQPTAGMGLIFLPGIYLPSVLFGLLYLLYSVYMSKKGTDNIGHDAHYWGAVWGFVFLVVAKPSLFMLFLEQIRYYMLYIMG